MASSDILTWEEFQDQAHRFRPSQKYIATTEPKTHHEWWDLDKDSIHSILKDIAEKITQATRTTHKLDCDLHHVAVTASKLVQTERPRSIKVALIGAQGAGKSMLINAIFDCDLSLFEAKGSACTSTVVKYAHASGEGFSAEVCFLNAKKRESLIEEHIRSLSLHYNDLDSDDEDVSRNRNAEQDQDDQNRKKTAEDFFRAIFGPDEDFKCAWSSDQDSAEFKSLCELKCQESTEGFDTNGKGAVIFTKTSPQDLLTVVKPFLSNVSDQNCLWPLVDHVIIRFNHPLLAEGLEIIDLPGYGDFNMSRVRHIDEVKDTVDVELVLGDTVRIGTDKSVINAARSGAHNHGYSNVKVVTTKIDMLLINDLSHTESEIYQYIDQLRKQADMESLQAEEEDDLSRMLRAERYKRYLDRTKKTLAIQERAINISAILGEILRGPSKDDIINIFHTSTSDYINWLGAEKIPYDRQPDLCPEDTGVPAVRRFLFNLPATQNLRSYARIINVTVPAFVDKLKRVVSQSDRDADFQTIASECNAMHELRLRELSKQIIGAFLSTSKAASMRAKKDVPGYKTRIDDHVRKHWVALPAAAFNRLLKSRGIVPKGTSKAKGLEKSVNWNADLARFLTPLFTKWHAAHMIQLRNLRSALPLWMNRFYFATVTQMNNTAANLVTVEKAKKKWSFSRYRLQTKVEAMVHEMMVEEKRLLNRVTLEVERENNLIAEITDSIYDEVFASFPELKSKPGQAKRYVMSPVHFRRNLLKELLISPGPQAHFVDKVCALYQEKSGEMMQHLVDKHFKIITGILHDIMKIIHDHGPVDFTIDNLGETMREVLNGHIPFIEAKAQTLRDLLPASLKKGHDETSTERDEFLEDSYDQIQDLKYFVDKVKSKRVAEMSKGGAEKKLKT